ncbi:MAG TPA: DHA2 family efflux MFS transporter permease subunit, partial [Hyphomicrobium sp.]
MSKSETPTFKPASDVPPGTLAWIGVTPRQLAGFLAMVFGMFMAILDIQIVSASLSEIQAGLSASSDEIPWVQTAYLIAEVVMIPLSGFLARALSTRVLFLSAAIGFTAASALCATATSIDQMIVYRALQGFIGGGMIPSVFAVAFSLFPPSKRNIVSPMIGLVATLAPTIGPTVGGYLSDAFSWHWLFLINVGPGILVAIAVYFLVDFDKPDYSLLNRFDFIGLGGMAVMLGSLEYVLEEGPRYDWLDDQTIATFAVLAVAGAVIFFWRVATAKEPIVELRAFRDRNFAFGSAFSFTMGIGLYGLTYIYPVYLAQVRGYDALMIGETMCITGIA